MIRPVRVVPEPSPKVIYMRHSCPSALRAAALVLLGGFLLQSSVVRAASDGATTRERILFDDGWRFMKSANDGQTGQLDYTVLRDWLLPAAQEFRSPSEPRLSRPAGEFPSVRQALPGTDDHAWRVLDLPHDWGVEGGFHQELDGSTGKLPWAGIGWYRKHFNVPATDAGRRISLEIDGAMSYATVWLNGELVGGWPYGYASFALDLTRYIKPGADNILAIRLDNLPESSRWYPGGGLYRNVWLVKTAPVHLAHWGTTVATPQVSADAATVTITSLVRNETTAPVNVRVITALYEMTDAGGRGAEVPGARATNDLRILAEREANTSQTVAVPHPKRWSIQHPQRYIAATSVEQDGRAIDNYETPFGIRTARFDAARGFLLNDEVVPIQGVCDHHDLGALGSAINVSALQRQLEILRAMGCNAIRTSHNPPAPELLELCDRLGFVVMDEAFDCWSHGKNRNDYNVLFADWHEADLRALVRRDHNHPSVVCWSIGNEVLEQGGDDASEGWKMAAHLGAIVREEDRTRPVVAAFNVATSGFNGFELAVDVMSYNYRIAEYMKFHLANPTIPLFGSETSSCVSSRGEYYFPVTNDKAGGQANFQVSSYDLSAPPWATTPDDQFRAADAVPGFAGEFVWTGFDYLGEPTPYGSDATSALNFSDPEAQAAALKELQATGKIPVPSRSSYFGIIDLAGFPKDRYYLYQSRWRPDLPMAHLLPHWTWPDRVGQVTPVHVYTSGDEAELFLNGRSLGRKQRGPGIYRLRWDDVRYEPGELRVVAYRHGARWAEDVVRTAGPAAAVQLTVDRSRVAADGAELAFVTARIVDAQGVLVPRANQRLRFQVTDGGDIVATDNGDATDHDAFALPERRAFNGLALAIVRAKKGASGTITLRAEGSGLATAEVKIEAGR